MRSLRAALAAACLHGCGEHPAVRGEVPDPFTRDERDAGSAQPLEERAPEIRQTVTRVADRALDQPAPFEVRDWPMAPLYDGLIDASLVSGDPRYLAAVIRAGRRGLFTSGSRLHDAESHAAGHAWLRIYLMMEPTEPGLLEPFEEMFDRIARHWTTGEPPPPRRLVAGRGTWADALYMSPPTIALLAKATGDARYLPFMDAEFRSVHDALFDEAENLFHGDAMQIDDRTPRGRKVFWSLDNARAYAGLARTLDALPADYPARSLYAGVLQRMATAVHAAQQADGFWYPSLHDPEHVLVPDTSASALFLLGTAWGVRRGLLERERYWPVVQRGWRAIATTIDGDGAIAFVQPEGEPPERFDPGSRASYGTGAVMMAGAEILRALNAAPRVDRAALVRRAQQLAPLAPDLATGCADPCGSPDAPSGAVRMDE